MVEHLHVIKRDVVAEIAVVVGIFDMGRAPDRRLCHRDLRCELREIGFTDREIFPHFEAAIAIARPT